MEKCGYTPDEGRYVGISCWPKDAARVAYDYLAAHDVPCSIPVLKQASLFACMTGLRISDILKLQWSDFEMGPDQGYYIRICTEKTETEATLPISHEALELCGE